MMKTFTDTVEKSLKSAEERASAVSKSLGENASTTTGAIKDASEQFAQTTDEMRKIAKQMESELHATREEMKKGVFQLPQEAKENAETMRKVVAEQIEALAELSQIVNRNGASLDVVRPQAAAGGGRSAPEPVAAKPAASRAGATPAPAPAAAPAEPKGSTPPTPAPATTAPAAAAPSAAAASPSNGSAGKTDGQSERNERKGWMSNLLSRASDDTTTGNGSAANGKMAKALGSLSADIAKAIDHKASTEVWERYNRGEKNAFTRRLYTLQGQHTFDEIRKKYQKSDDFKKAVDRYVADFERLLDEAKKNGNDAKATDSYLASDTGKVYTMLAHASGRFD